MSSSPGPLSSTSPEVGPPASGGTIVLPPQTQITLTTAITSPKPRASDWLLTLLVVILAFLAASFPARNSDLWFHLATGRLLAQGQFTFGVDPFAYTTHGVYWACHSWLFDFGLYQLYNLLGGASLVVFKAVFISALAGMLLSVRRGGSAAFVPAVCTTLAIVAMSPRLLLQPACLSYGFLGLTFWLLWRPHATTGGSEHSADADPKPDRARPPSGADARRWTSHAWLLLLFVLWVNVDEWFMLGPALVVLFVLGERLQGQRLTPLWVVPAGLAACLLNPYTYHAFTLPSELSAVFGAGELSEDVRFQAIFASPWAPAHLPINRFDPVALAYYALTLLGVGSFLVTWRSLLGWRFLVWLPFAIWAAWNARAIPFFAVVAAPITALNWQDYLAGRGHAAAGVSSASFGPLVARLIVAPALLALLYFTWTGWQIGAGREGRHVAWGFQADPSLQRGAEVLHDWRRRGLLPAGQRVFAVSPEMADYCAWFCPGDEQFFDHRYPLFSVRKERDSDGPGTPPIQDYETVCRALLSGSAFSQSQPRHNEQGQDRDWRKVLNDRHVSVVVISDRDPQRLFAVLGCVADNPEQWTLLDVAGQTLIVGWNEAPSRSGFSPPAFDANRLAFGSQDDSARRGVPAAPDNGPERLPESRDLWDRLSRPPAPPSWQSAAATMYLHYADDTEDRERQREKNLLLHAFGASLAGLPAMPSNSPLVAMHLVSSRALLFAPENAPLFLVRDQLGPFFAPLIERSPALPLLAVRAARQAVAANPEDANAWLRLGQAYLFLRDSTCEHSNEGLLPPLSRLRHVQIVSALEQALRLDPDLEAAHHELAYLYGNPNCNYLDQALDHRREEALLSRRNGPRQGESAEVFADRLELLEKDTAKLVEVVEQQRKKYASGSHALQGGPLVEADLALRLGLARQALDKVLMPTPADVLGPAGLQLELDLLLRMGRAAEVRTILNDEEFRASKQGLSYYDMLPPRGADGFPLYTIPYLWPAYEWLHVVQSAAVGDYGLARDELHAIRTGLRTQYDADELQLRAIERRLCVQAAEMVCYPPSFLPAFKALALAPFLDARINIEAHAPTLRAQQADLFVLEGLLALEQGDTDAARSAFAQAQKRCAEPSAVPFAGSPIAGSYLRRLNAND